MWRSLMVIALCAAALSACGTGEEEPAMDRSEGLVVVEDIAARRAQFVPHVLETDLSHLSAGDRQALVHLIEAARIMDRIFFEQAWAENPAFADRVRALSGADAGVAQEYYRIMYGPWDRLRDFEPFLGTTPRPEGAGFYPADLDEAELDAWLEAHPEDRESFTSLTTIIRRQGDGLVAIPYGEAWATELAAAAGELRAAAAATDNESLRRFLELRAEAFASDDYYESDKAWMDLDSAIEVVIGPYETYEDTLRGLKAAFEAFICVAQPEDSKRLEGYKKELPFLERSLPIPDEHKNFDRGSESPIRVADEIFTGGDCRAGVQTLAFNLPNDERVREEKGSKKVMLKNVMQAKYDAILEPIAGVVLPAEDAARLDFDAYFHFILFHELSHGLGPGRIVVGGRETEVRLELKDLYSALEEAKADVVSVHSLYALAERDGIPEGIIDALPWTYTAGLFRSARFGTTEAHGLGVVMQTNFLLDKGAIEVTEEGRFRPVADAFPAAFEALAHDLLMVQAEGSYAGAEELVERFGQVRPEMAQLIDRLTAIPVDVDPVYTLKGLD
jgi:hypothetical protein